MKEYFTEVKCDYLDDNGFWTVDAWRSNDPDAEGEVIAVISDATGGVFYTNVDAHISPMAQEVIKIKIAEITSGCDTKFLMLEDICKHLKEEGYNGWSLLLSRLKAGVLAGCNVIQSQKNKVYVVTVNEVCKFEQLDHDPMVFNNIEEARQYLSAAKDDAIGDYMNEDENKDEVEDMRIDKDTEDCFSLFNSAEGWSYTHYEVSICECEIAHLNIDFRKLNP